MSEMEPMGMNPRLRVMPMPVEVQGKQMLLFQDPDRLTDETVLMPIEAAAIVQFLDGTRSVREIQEELMRQSGQLIDTGLIQNLVDQLDEHLLLESPRLHAHLRALNDAWMAEPVRPASHAGTAYPEDRDELIGLLDSFYTAEGGPGALPRPNQSNELKAIAAPHMSITDSGPCTAHAFKALVERSQADLFVIIGTGHNEPQRPFVMSDKDFATPLGVAKTDRELVERITRLRHNRNPLDDYVHKDEHSIEFMVVFLQHAMKDREFKILPVLAGGLTSSLVAQTPPGPDPEHRDFMEALRTALSERGGKVCFIAGVDLAHLGPRYGDQETWAPIRMGEEEQADRAMLAPLQRGDADGFFLHVAGQRDARKVCGLASLYATIRATRAGQGELLKWAYWHDNTTNSVVTFASLAFS